MLYLMNMFMKTKLAVKYTGFASFSITSAKLLVRSISFVKIFFYQCLSFVVIGKSIRNPIFVMFIQFGIWDLCIFKICGVTYCIIGFSKILHLWEPILETLVVFWMSWKTFYLFIWMWQKFFCYLHNSCHFSSCCLFNFK